MGYPWKDVSIIQKGYLRADGPVGGGGVRFILTRTSLLFARGGFLALVTFGFVWFANVRVR